MNGEVAALLDRLSREQREVLFQRLRREFPIHPLEKEWNTSAEAILEAIRRSSSLTQRGVRGVLAEASFVSTAILELQQSGWKEDTPEGDIPFDIAIHDATGVVRIQIKMQRSKEGRPMTGDKATKSMAFSSGFFVVETQKTRGGTKGGEDTRPYRFGEFDVLGVCMYPATGRWDRFLYTVANWLIPDPDNGGLIYKFQPVPPDPNMDWTDRLQTCIEWLRSGAKKTLGRRPGNP